MIKPLTQEQVTQEQHNANLRSKIKGLFSEITEVRADAIEALGECWDIDKPSFRMEEMGVMDPQIIALAAMRRDTIKEVINWLTKI